MVGLRALAAVPGLGERDAIERAMAKLEQATGASAEAAARVEVAIDEGVEAGLLADARRAVEDHRRVHLRYLVPSRDESTERDVDPMRVVNLDVALVPRGLVPPGPGHPPVPDGPDRVAARCSTRTAPRPRRPQLRDLDAGTFTPRPDDTLVTLRLEAGRRLGERLLPGGVGGDGARRVADRHPAHRRHALAAPPDVAARRARHGRWRPPSWPTAVRERRRRPPSRHTTARRVGSGACGGGF